MMGMGMKGMMGMGMKGMMGMGMLLGAVEGQLLNGAGSMGSGGCTMASFTARTGEKQRGESAARWPKTASWYRSGAAMFEPAAPSLGH